jgi:hypothetical protein
MCRALEDGGAVLEDGDAVLEGACSRRRAASGRASRRGLGPAGTGAWGLHSVTST